MNKRLEKLEVRGKGTLGDKSHLRKSVVIERHSNSAYGESWPALSCWSVAFWAQLLSGGAGVVDANDDGWDEPTVPIRPCVLPALSAWLALLLVGFCRVVGFCRGRILSPRCCPSTSRRKPDALTSRAGSGTAMRSWPGRSQSRSQSRRSSFSRAEQRSGAKRRRRPRRRSGHASRSRSTTTRRRDQQRSALFEHSLSQPLFIRIYLPP